MFASKISGGMEVWVGQFFLTPQPGDFFPRHRMSLIVFYISMYTIELSGLSWVFFSSAGQIFLFFTCQVDVAEVLFFTHHELVLYSSNKHHTLNINYTFNSLCAI